ncbi:MAG: hypothetical protein RR544_06975, partial [Oscillospiraceae bacterium]
MRLLTETDAIGHVATWSYDANNRSISHTDRMNQESVYEYDSMGRLTKETNPLNHAESYTYDKAGNRLTVTDRNHHTTVYAYDGLNRLISTTDPEGAISETAYDYLGNISAVTTWGGNEQKSTTRYGYDGAGFLLTETSPLGYVTSYENDKEGNPLKKTDRDGKAVTNTYNDLGQVTRLQDYDGKGLDYTYNWNGLLTEERHSDGSRTTYAYNRASLIDLQRETTAGNKTLREIIYGHDDAGNLTSERRTGVNFDKRTETVDYTYDKASRLTKTVTMSEKGVTSVQYAYDKAGNLLDDGKYTYTYDLQNRLLTKAGTDGTTTYTYDAAGNLLKKTAPDGLSTYEYTAQNKLKKGTNPRGETSEYSYNALGVRVQNIQIRGNANMGYMNALLNNGSRFMKDYMAALSDGRNTWQPTWETEVGTTVQNATEKVTKNYVVDYLSVANRDIMVESEGQYTQRYVYDENSRRISAEFDYGEGTKRGEPGENIASDTAVNELGKVWYRTSLLGSTLFAVDADGEVVSHAIYDPW